MITKIIGVYQFSCGSELQELKPDTCNPEKAPHVFALLEKVYLR